MPFYEYQCPHCGYDVEVLQNITDKPLTKCPDCGKKGLRKLISAPVFRLKGSGWYETDFKSDQEKKRNLAGAEKEEAKTEAKTEPKTDSKSDAKSDSKADAAKPEAKSEAAKPAVDKPATRKTHPRHRPRRARAAKRRTRH